MDTNGPINCGAPAYVITPSLSFLSAFPGIHAAGEVIKRAGSGRGLRGRFDHVFGYGPNPDMASSPGFRDDFAVGRRPASKIAQYRRQYPSEA